MDGSGLSLYGIRDAAAQTRRMCAPKYCRNTSSRGIRIVVHGDDFMSGGPQALAGMAGKSHGQRLPVEAHRDVGRLVILLNRWSC